MVVSQSSGGGDEPAHAWWRGRRQIEPPSTRFRIAVASLIAFTSLLAALAAWRAEAASLKGDEVERKGFAESVADEHVKARIHSTTEQDLIAYDRALSYFAQARALQHEAAVATSGDAVRLRTQARAHRELGTRLLRGEVSPDALRRDGSLDLEREFEINYAQAKLHTDLDPTPEFHEADTLSVRSERDVGLTALLIAAAFFFTLGQVAMRRTRMLYVAGGGAVLVSASVLLLLVEVIG